mmetsp:Transcript_2261/g.2565  ORF Transcript_2261/g.2565 Transcript_2261/m.2565 type:complete len:477 (+) Transcript_2261:204-1634(+)
MSNSKAFLGIISITTASTISLFLLTVKLFKKKQETKNQNIKSYETLIGNTPLIHLQKLSSRLGQGKNIYTKMECMNPGGTGKDRAALYMLRDAESRGHLPPPLPLLFKQRGKEQQEQPSWAYRKKSKISHDNLDSSNNNKSSDSTNNIQESILDAIQRSRTGGIVVEGTSGSTGISLSTLCAQRGHSVIIVMPDDQSKEKHTILRCLGAVLHVVPTAAISNPNHYVNIAKKISEEINRGGYNINDDSGRIVKAAFMNQFENEANYNAHYSTTGPELWCQTNGKIDAFCMSSGTGGTISGVGQYLKEKLVSAEKNRDCCDIVLIDPPGSALYNKVKYNVAFASEQKERALLRHRYDTIAEGIGLDRITNNFAIGVDAGVIDDAIRVTDQEAVDMAHWLLKEEGIFVGSSSAMNVVGAIRLATDSSNFSGKCIVTIICDGGQRHLTRFWNRDFIKQWGLVWPGDDELAWMSRLPSCLV